MTLFVVVALALSALVVGVLLWPLLRPRAGSGVSQARVNAQWHTEQLAALEAERAAGRLADEAFAQAKEELALRLLDEEEADASAQARGAREDDARRSPRVAVLVALLVPLVGAALYGLLGAPAAIDPQATQRAQQEEIEKMVEGLAAKLRTNPDDHMGWAMLGRSYKILGRTQEAAAAFEKSGPLLESNPDVMASYADLLATQAGNSLRGRPAQLVGKALQVNPQHPMSLMLAAAGAFREEDYALAVRFWEALQRQLEPESEDWKLLQSNIDEARQRGKLPGAAPGAAQGASMGATAPAGGMAAASGAPDPVAMTERLAARLKANPNDPAGWARLGRAYTVLGRLDDAEAAFRRSGLVDTDAAVKADYDKLQALRKRAP